MLEIYKRTKVKSYWNNRERITKRIIVYCLGLLLMSIGIVFSVKSNLGVSPVSSIPYTLTLITGVGLGITTVLVYFAYIAIQVLMLRRDFKPSGLLQILCTFLFGYFISFSYLLLHAFPAPENYATQLVYLGISIVFVAVGILLYIPANIVYLPAEGVMQAMVKQKGIKMATAKIRFDCTVVVISAISSIAFLYQLGSVREGTVFAAIGVGWVLSILSKPFERPIRNFLYA
jgi:Predicted membrane protein